MASKHKGLKAKNGPLKSVADELAMMRCVRDGAFHHFRFSLLGNLSELVSCAKKLHVGDSTRDPVQPRGHADKLSNAAISMYNNSHIMAGPNLQDYTQASHIKRAQSAGTKPTRKQIRSMVCGSKRWQRVESIAKVRLSVRKNEAKKGVVLDCRVFPKITSIVLSSTTDPRGGATGGYFEWINPTHRELTTFLRHCSGEVLQSKLRFWI
ncbi:hypothetical protein CPB83DRAFT_131192 [Crepidotus variabilis]|uniref:Uncharacterized protein n=1 Tax=Crepidotus variabilis TaxID=179855 RepID=A0A9P6JRV5_9AGAR|nr:hypothetical protein CPB83DRAFT_131192 [Crepidotus variabilis]